MARFEDLDVWRRPSRLCVEIYRGLATCKDFGFSKETGISWKNEAEQISKMLSALIKSRSA